ANKGIYPRLLRIAFDFYSIPFIVDDCKRSFSSAKLTLSSQRHCLVADSINIIETIKF
ncbi:hypothetical protein NEUTE1DRAFT_54937, partial [Neurospora tetrasperma FGSC 2508]